MKSVMLLVVAAGLSVLSIGAQPPQDAANHPEWAFPVPSKDQPPAPDPKSAVHIPDSTKSYTAEQIDDLMNPPDWFPADHPAAPSVVTKGDGPMVMACGSCHLMSGNGHPESANLAGLPATYLTAQMQDFKSGARKDPIRMTGIGMAASDDDVKAAADWFASLPRVPWVKVVEADMVPKTYTARARGRFPLPGGAMEPLGKRILEIPQDVPRVLARDPRAPFIAYVPVGSLAKGKDLVSTGGDGKTLPCAICHGDGLKGMGDTPRIAGLSPEYIGRQLFNFKSGQSNGPMAQQMVGVVANLTDDDILNLAAYVASQTP